MPAPIFITGIGTGVGKTLVAAILTEALGAAYWKPVQAGYAEGTDTGWVKDRVSNPDCRFFPEKYILKLPASPHIAAREEGIKITVKEILDSTPVVNGPLVIEGAGGLLVPLNEYEFVADLVKALDARLIIVSRNYLGSINHSLLTSEICRSRLLNVAGWIFNDQFGNYEKEIAHWSALPVLSSIPFDINCDLPFIQQQAGLLRPQLEKLL